MITAPLASDQFYSISAILVVRAGCKYLSSWRRFKHKDMTGGANGEELALQDIRENDG